MALWKQFNINSDPFNAGTVCGYWVIVNINMDKWKGITYVELALFESAATSRNAQGGEGKRMWTKMVQLRDLDVDRAKAYAAIKALPDFYGAEDC